MPQLWLLTWRRPRKLLASHGLTAMADWPAGFYQAAPGWRFGVVVLPELPPTRETLPLRLFGHDAMRVGLRAEYDALAREDPMRQAVGSLLVCWTLWLRGQPQDQALKRWLMTFQQVVQSELTKLMAESTAASRAEGVREGKAEGVREGKAEGVREGKAEGVREGLRAAVVDGCELLGIPLTKARTAHLTALDVAGLELLRAHLKRHRAWPA